MQCKKFRCNKIVMTIFVMLYLSFSNFYCFLPSLNIAGLGRLYDVVFFIAIGLYLKFNNGGINIIFDRKITPVFWVWVYWVIFAFIRGALTEDFFSAFRSIRDYFSYFIIWFFVFMKYDAKKIVKLLIKMEFIAAIIYLIQFALQKPFLNGYYTYMYVGIGYVYRFYEDLPVFGLFSYIYLLMAILEKRTVISKGFDKIAVFIFAAATICTFTRNVWMLFIVETLLCILVIKNKNVFISNLKKIGLVIAILVIVVVIVPKVAPGITYKMTQGISNISNNEGSMQVRNELIRSRYQYLEDAHDVFWGVGALNPDTKLNFSFDMTYATDNVNNVKSADSAYAELMLKFGIVGVAIYLCFYIVAALVCYKGTSIGKAVGIYLIVPLVSSYFGHNLISGTMLISVLIGLALKDKYNEKYL